ncbi:flagellin [Cellulomonas sp. JZ18]|uniref:flagellin N-terminal helical domain-containing protein n=1 Tax=Cellulomonas sp. JZ18 TaxID=2654191 RepID=UPI0012D42107|nr:flagellin [Cellulomonas sp. JZ18]QGQ20313.1 flagellin [Cellulomonas sp. JZ18]
MGLSINTNIAAMNSYRNLSATQGDLSSSLEKLSSGLRINRAADDAAGLAISEGLRAQIGGTKQAVRNAQDGISVVQTAEGALTETHSILQRMRTLAVQGGNTGGLSADAKKNIQDEMDQLNKELTRIADTTQFNGAKLLDGNYNGTFQVGANTAPADKIEVNLTKITGGVSAEGLGVDGVRVADLAASKTYSAVAATAAGSVTIDGGATIAIASGATLGGIATAINNAGQTGVSAEVVNGELVISKTGATGALGVTFSGVTATEDAAAAVTGAVADSDGAIEAIDKAITTVSSVRSELGAVQNRFDHTINNLNVAVENLSASESRIRDTDMAEEMVSFTRAQILSQAGTAMLAQAKSLPQSVLQLLQ